MVRAEEQVCSRALRTTHGAKWDWEADVKPGTRVLVIEDDRSIAQLVELELEERDLDVRCCHDGILGLEAVTEFEPAVILLDIMLPGVDGWEICRFMAGDPALKNIPIVIFTAKSAREDFDLARQYNLAGFFTKPYATADVLRHVEKVLSNQNGAAKTA